MAIYYPSQTWVIALRLVPQERTGGARGGIILSKKGFLQSQKEQIILSFRHTSNKNPGEHRLPRRILNRSSALFRILQISGYHVDGSLQGSQSYSCHNFCGTSGRVAGDFYTGTPHNRDGTSPAPGCSQIWCSFYGTSGQVHHIHRTGSFPLNTPYRQRSPCRMVQ